jgi:hypothetical protein
MLRVLVSTVKTPARSISTWSTLNPSVETLEMVIGESDVFKPRKLAF